MERELDSDIRLGALRKVAFAPFSFVTAAVLAAMALLAWLDGSAAAGIVLLSVAGLSAVNVAIYYRFKNLFASSAVIVGLISLAALYIYYAGVAQTVGDFWMIIIPIPTIMLLGRLVGAVVVAAYTLAFLPSLLFSDALNIGYSNRYILMVMFAVNVVMLLMFAYERILHYYIGVSETHTDRLNTAANHLKEEIAQREQMEYKMRIVLEDLANKNQKLEEMTRIDEATISSIGEAVLMVDHNGVITRANPSSGRVLGLNQEELIKRKIHKLITFYDMEEGDKVEESKLVIAQSLKHRSIIETTYKAKRKDGSDFYALMSASPLVVSGTVFGAVVVVRDVTQEVNVDQAKTEFVSIASHQLRTPLSTINWYLEMVLNGDFGDITDEQREYIKEAYDAGQRMGHLIDSLLNVSRIDVGVFAIDPKPLDFKAAVNDVLEDLSARIAEKNIDVSVNIADEIDKPNFDERLINIILENLISNAVKYTPNDGKVKVNISGSKRIKIEVSDTGYGIPAHQQDKIFSKMFRAENAVEHEPDGTGLGLYIIKSIVDESRGTISFQSKEGEGTTFTVELPQDGMKARKGSRELTEGAGV